MQYRAAMKLRVSLAVAALTALPTFAHAQGSNGQFAETAFNEGRRLFDQGQIAAACSKFQSSLDLEFQRSTLQALAICREKEEKWASAWQNYLELGRRFGQAGEEDKARLARQKASELEKKLLYVVLVMDPPIPAGVEITLDGTKLDAALLGTRLPVDPGHHDVVVTAKGKKTWKQGITVGPSPAEQQVKIAKLEDAPASEQSPASSYQLPGPMRTAPGFWTTQRTVGAIVGGAGILALGGAAVFQIVALSEDSKRKEGESAANTAGEPQLGQEGCRIGVNTNLCKERAAAKTREDAAGTNQTVAIVLASAGGAMIITGVVLIATGGHKSSSATWKPKSPLLADFSLTPTATPRSFGLAGTF